MHSVEDAAHAIRRLVPGDAEELTALLAANREFLAPYVPDQPAGFFRANTQRARIARAEHLYGILDRGALAGTIALTNLVRGEFQSANVGYWVDEARNGRGLATRSLGALVEVAFDGLALHRLEAGHARRQRRIAARARTQRLQPHRNRVSVSLDCRRVA